MEIITTHKNVDFDALASVFASSILFPDASAVIPKSMNPNVRAFLSIHKGLFSFITPKEVEPDKVTKLVIVDTNSWRRLEDMDEFKNMENLEISVWDHHSETGDIEAHRSCHELVGATTTLLTSQLRERKESFSSIQATLFLAGIYEDTGNLTFPSTTARDAEAVAFLLEKGADLNMIKNFLRPVYGPAQKGALFEMLKKGKRIKANGYVISINRIDIEGHTPGLSLVVDMYQDIMNVDAAFGIFIDSKRGRCMLIGRSSAGGPDVGSIMRSVGGGGHPNAGSALIRSMEPENLEELIVELVRGKQRASVQISDLMSFPVFTVSPDKTMKDVALLLREKGCTGIPVADGENLVGVISRRDFKKIKKSSQLDLSVKAFMSTKIMHIDAESSVVQAARLMVKHDIGRLPVLQDGKLIGIITRSDTMRYYYDLPPG